ncbi:UNVERIFIED_CONTAM: E3 ubiquitin ligase PARAQUAT TOLERANCE 3 [Sesamum radiatum]|uniref:E3 ubiquitin ligase PARAQUAT TOLERANCE 3 n=1 Tax=Sesamum radiatum TaxID=300843 RepID=A0AAW2MDB9_SESRA
MKFGEDLEWDEFGNDLYAIPENVHVQSSIPVQDATPVNKEDEESKIKALIDTPALDWQRQPSDGFGPGRGFGRGMGGRMMGGRGFAADMQWRTAQDLAPENYMMPMGPSAFNPYWSGIQPGLDGFMPPYGGPVPYMGYGLSPMDVAFGGVIPHDPFGGPGCMLPYGGPPQRDLAELAMGFNPGPPIMSREEFEARKADLKRKREMERRGESFQHRELPKDREYGIEGSSTVDVSSKSKSKSIPPPSSADQQPIATAPRGIPDRRPGTLSSHLPRRNLTMTSLTMKTTTASSSASDKKKASVFSRISFPENESSAPKKRKLSSSSEVPPTGTSSHRTSALSNGHHDEHKAASGSRKSGAAVAVAAVDHDSSDDERHFKRRPSRYASSPQPAASAEEEPRHSRGSRDRERERDRGGYSKHR